jgi:hypothetical protein
MLLGGVAGSRVVKQHSNAVKQYVVKQYSKAAVKQLLGGVARATLRLTLSLLYYCCFTAALLLLILLGGVAGSRDPSPDARSRSPRPAESMGAWMIHIGMLPIGILVAEGLIH